MLVAKFVTLLISPLGTTLLLGGLALLAALRRQSRWSLGLGLAALVWLWLWSMPVASLWLRAQIEQQHPARSVQELPMAQAIVVLGGGVSPPQPERREANLGSAADRLWFAARLYHAGKAPLLVLSGGRPLMSLISEAEAMRSVMQDFGVPTAATLLESASRNTRENAALTAALLRQRGIDHILLVTSALHMERARRHFVAEGLRVVPAPTDFEAVPEVEGVLRFLPDAEVLFGSARAFKEIVGTWSMRGYFHF